LTNTFAPTGTFTETFSPGTFPTAEPVSLGYLASTSLPAPLSVARFRHVKNGVRLPQFTQGAGNTYIVAFCTTFGATPATSVALSGTGIVPNTITAGTQLNIAIYSGGTWVDVGTAIVGASGNFAETAPTVSLPGITAAGTYLVYEPAGGTNVSSVNLGFALIADDSTADTHGLQFVQIEDPSGNAYATPTTTYIPVNGGDLDGQSLTPDASHGAIVDGSNTVYFFSGIPQHNITVSSTTIDVTNYGGDGDSIVSLPTGDEVVVTADNGGALAIISGILSGSPVIADTIPNPSMNYRDGLAISQDGKIMLARGQFSGTPGIDVYTIAAVAPHVGSTGMGTTSYNFTLSQTLSSTSPGTLSTPFFEDGRDAMAISPVDSSRAVVGGYNASVTPEIQLLTGLGTGSATINRLVPRLPASVKRARAIRLPYEPSHRPAAALIPNPSTDVEITAVAITPDGTTAFVNTTAGIITVSGVNTGTLAQVGSVYAPTITVPGGTCTWATTIEGSASIGITPDGKYLVLDPDCDLSFSGTSPQFGPGVLLTIPIGPGGVLGAPVGQLNYVVSPYNDQILVH
jgi:hypothetical protein